MALSKVRQLDDVQRSEVCRAVETLVDFGLSAASVQDLAEELGITGGDVSSTWRNIFYGTPRDRRLKVQSAALRDSQVLGSVPFGCRLTVAQEVRARGQLWLQLGAGRYKGGFVLARSGGEVSCVDMAAWVTTPGAVPSSAYNGQDFPEEGMYTEGYAGGREVCVISASGDALWREVNIEMLFRDFGTATVFEGAWGGSDTFTTWVAYYAANVALHTRLLSVAKRRLIVTVRPTKNWRRYQLGLCQGPPLSEVLDDIGLAQAKECEWVEKNQRHLDIKWEEVAFVTALCFLKSFCEWTEADCLRAATTKLLRVWQRWPDLTRPERQHQLQAAVFCLEEALNGAEAPEDARETVMEILADTEGCALEDPAATTALWRLAVAAPAAELPATLAAKVGDGGLRRVVADVRADVAKRALEMAGYRGSLYALGGYTGSEPLSAVDHFNPEAGRWEPLAPLPTARQHLATAVLRGCIYALGGYCKTWRGGLAESDAAERLDPKGGRWERLAPLPTARCALAAVALGGRLYALGGYAGENSAAVEHFDPETGRWEAAAPLPRARSYLAAAALGGRLYALGGYGEGGRTSVVEWSEPRTGRWEAAAPLPTLSGYLAAAALGGWLYALGGYNAGAVSAAVERFDPQAGRWEAVAPLPRPRGWLAAAALGGRLYALGGYCAGLASDVVDVYDPEDDSWKRAPALPTARGGLAAVAVHLP